MYVVANLLWPRAMHMLNVTHLLGAASYSYYHSISTRVLYPAEQGYNYLIPCLGYSNLSKLCRR